MVVDEGCGCKTQSGRAGRGCAEVVPLLEACEAGRRDEREEVEDDEDCGIVTWGPKTSREGRVHTKDSLSVVMLYWMRISPRGG